MVDDDREARDGIGERDNVGQLGVEDPGVEDQRTGRLASWLRAESRAWYTGPGRALVGARTRASASQAPDSANPPEAATARRYVPVERLLDHIARGYVGPPDDPFADPRRPGSPDSLIAATPAANSVSPTGLRISGPVARYITPASANTVATIRCPEPRSSELVEQVAERRAVP